ncbi:MAG TPA: hypothetical protein DCS93_25920 [Microscillaceae bacterium]|nr:hypothetical protein [Microscillaceae bacterium]
MKKLAFYTLLLLLLTSCEHLVINASEAAQHVGKYATVKGKVASVKSLNLGRSNEIHLINLTRPHPNQDFTIAINGRYINRFGPVTNYEGKTIQATGKIYLYKGKPQMKLKVAKKLRVIQ